MTTTSSTTTIPEPGWPCALVLENGRIFRGRGFGARVRSIGEVVFNTSITGYQEIVSDPSYCGQIISMTATEIGNVGVNAEDDEAARPACAGFVVRDASATVSSWRATDSLHAWLAGHGVPGIDDLDTRALTRCLRDEGAMRGAIAPAASDAEIEAVLAAVRAAPSMEGQDLVPRVTCDAAYTWDAPTWHAKDATPPMLAAARHRVVAVDFGIKQNILRQLRVAGCAVTVVPATTPAADILARNPDGIFLSNGPGDPAAVAYAIATVRELLAARLPVFGICLGHQILGLALGARTFKLPFGHHGGNHPVQDLTTGKVEITSQNHGFAVDPASLPSGVRVSHKNLFDGSIEGLEVEGRSVFGIQYHPEASPGPHDASYLFHRFADGMARAAAARGERR
ncbi:MAG: glutamine-hydrolyzing carbamoyl-phosphate synthase small subunit [Kofleriaceae bacterium]|nr:glutamine-hydrolyzing carbamoyl-phosphate synthase small subunit [Myxococcales bacterium]MCB9571970.1 glutamine-hydrolyzing carbamoyl-phosphate synthase small subunit [Kofleriaceae bacterium]